MHIDDFAVAHSLITQRESLMQQNAVLSDELNKDSTSVSVGGYYGSTKISIYGDVAREAISAARAKINLLLAEIEDQLRGYGIECGPKLPPLTATVEEPFKEWEQVEDSAPVAEEMCPCGCGYVRSEHVPTTQAEAEPELLIELPRGPIDDRK